jgi:hypothetical protein
MLILTVVDVGKLLFAFEREAARDAVCVACCSIVEKKAVRQFERFEVLMTRQKGSDCFCRVVQCFIARGR